MNKTRHYIAYGSNLNTEQMGFRCPNATVVGTSEIDGYRLLYKGSMTGSYLTIEEKKGGKVPVAVWEISAFDEHQLDLYEGFPYFYYKMEFVLDVKTQEGTKKLICFAYIMREDRKPGIPSRQYVETCRQGYMDFGLDQKYLYKALQDTKRKMKKEPLLQGFELYR